MIRIIIILALIFSILILLRWFVQTAPAEIRKNLQRFLMLGGGFILIVLIASGHLNWLLPVIGGLIAILARSLPYFLRFAPVLQRLWSQYRTSRPPRPKAENVSVRHDDMTRAEALEILGLTSDSSPREIVEAHRRLIQKIHPDRGGSDYLAAKINRARDVLHG